MDFYIRTDAQKWFKGIRSELDQQPGKAGNMSMYYFCAMAGLAANRKNPSIKAHQLASLVDHFPKQFDKSSKLIIASLLTLELERAGHTLEVANREKIELFISDIIKPDSPYLTDEGMKRLDKYAHGGFDVLEDKLEPPVTLSAFLSDYSELIAEIQKNEQQ